LSEQREAGGERGAEETVGCEGAGRDGSVCAAKG
jgi:hypothetical protein